MEILFTIGITIWFIIKFIIWVILILIAIVAGICMGDDSAGPERPYPDYDRDPYWNSKMAGAIFICLTLALWIYPFW